MFLGIEKQKLGQNGAATDQTLNAAVNGSSATSSQLPSSATVYATPAQPRPKSDYSLHGISQSFTPASVLPRFVANGIIT